MKNETFEPLIHTIPDDTMIFAALHTNDCVCKKIITENYINFYARRHQFVRDVIVRFENLIDYESIRGLKRIFIPSDFMMQFASNPKNILDLLNDGYHINMPVAKPAISFYHKGDTAHHHMMIYGADSERRVYFCKDFSGQEFVEFETGFDNLILSAKMYENPCSIENDGILAFKVDKSVEKEINYSKVYLELQKLKRGKNIGDYDAYGLSAIDYFLSDIGKDPCTEMFFIRWCEMSNYLRESAKLMKFRLGVIREDRLLQRRPSQDEAIEQLFNLTSKLYFLAWKYKIRKIKGAVVNDSLSEAALECKKAFLEVVDMLLELIEEEI